MPVTGRTRLTASSVSPSGDAALNSATLWHKSHYAQAVWPLLAELASGTASGTASVADAASWQGIAACAAEGDSALWAAIATSPAAIPTCMFPYAQPRKGSRASRIHKTTRRERMGQV